MASSSDAAPPRAAGLSVVVPALDEADRLPATLEEILTYGRTRSGGIEVIVVDDGSADATADRVLARAAEHPELRLLRNETNHGKGHAARRGVLAARGDRILVADADGATPIREVEKLERRLSPRCPVVVGSRAFPDRSRLERHPGRILLGSAFHALQALLGVRLVRDTQCGFKLFEARVGKELFRRLQTERFAFDMEILLRARQAGWSVEEVPVDWHHVPGSRIRWERDLLEMTRAMIRMRRMLRREARSSAPPAPRP